MASGFRAKLLANAAIAASRVGSYPCAARRISPLWLEAHIQGRALRPDCIEEKDGADNDAVLQHVVIVPSAR
jgi:hypothetical protein